MGDNKKKFRLPIDTYGDKKKLSILNPNNQLVTPQVINQIFETCGLNYKVRDLDLFQLGLTHRSYVVINNPEIEYEKIDDCVELQAESNERLEFQGDHILGTIVSSYIFHRYFKGNEGFLTKLKTKLVRTKTLARFSTYLGLGPYILMSKHVEDVCAGRHNEAILENTFEALVGTLFEDVYNDDLANYGKAMQVCCDFIVNLMENTINWREVIAMNDNYKEQLLQYFQKNFGGIHVVYHTINVEGPTNKRIYTMGVYHPKHPKLLIGQGIAKKKVQAEQLASKMAIEYFESNPHSPDENDLKLEALKQEHKQLLESWLQVEAECRHLCPEGEEVSADKKPRYDELRTQQSQLDTQMKTVSNSSDQLRKTIQDIIDKDQTYRPLTTAFTAEDDSD